MKELSTFIVTITAWASVCRAQNITFTTIASSSFTLFLRPTFQKLNLPAILSVQDAVSATLFLARSENNSLPMIGSFQVLPQQVQWLNTAAQDLNSSLQGLELPTSTFEFAVLATVVATSNDPAPSALDAFINSTFVSQIYEASFEKLLKSSGNPLLMDVVNVEIAVVSSPATENPGTPNATGSTRLISNSDIALLVISGCIFLGVVYMIYRHHFDQGYIETQRMRFFSGPEPAPYSNSAPSSFRGCHSPAAIDYVEHQHKHSVAPQTPLQEEKKDPATPSTADIAPESPEPPDRPPTPVTTPDQDLNHHKFIDVDATEPASTVDIVMSEVFTSKWFKSQESLLAKSEEAGNASSESDELDGGDDFHMEVAQMSPLSQDSKPPRPTKRTLSDWMKAIRVVSSDKTCETATMERSSSVEPSVEASSVNTSNNERYSLEHSMARSAVALEQQQQAHQQLEI
jgi:hypothetical protein